MRNTIKKRDFAVLLSPVISAFSSIIYVTKALPSNEEDQNRKIDEQVKQIQKQEDSSYIAKLEESTNNSKNTRKRKISVRKVESESKTQSAKIKKINKEDNKELERRI